ncbi:MAG: DsbA family protein [Myxococcota bacterium]|nr:DsbA family protein [Myxococcota bacterium]
MPGFDPLASDRPLIVYVDFKSPYAYIAIEPTLALAAELGIEIDWRPLTLDIPSYLGSAKLDRKGKVAESQRTPEQWSGVKYAYRDARRYAGLQDRMLRGTTKIWDSSLASIALQWVTPHGADATERFLWEVYPPFWRRELDIEDPEVVAARIAAAGVPTDGFRDYLEGEGRARHDAEQAAIFEAGIYGVPTYVVDREFFFGRENLPLVRWMLGGQEAPVPDPANPVAGVAADPDAERRIRVAVDVKSAEVWLGLAATRRLAAAAGVELDWLPLRGTALTDPARHEGADRSSRHKRNRARYLAHHLERQAAWRELPLEGLHRSPDSTPFALGLLHARSAGRADAFVEAALAAHWSGSADVSSPTEVEALLQGVGVDTGGFAAFAQGPGLEALESVEAELRSEGAFSTPTYLFGGEPYQGRQHLSLLAARLGVTEGAA